MKRALITGGSGYIGRHFIRHLLEKYPDIEITSLSRSEGPIKQLLVESQSNRLKIVMADVRDKYVVQSACRGIDTVLHLAAMKHVDLSEINCREAISVNVIGTMNLLDSFLGNTFVLMSTDKAVEPVNCYGASKLTAEKLVLEQAHKQENGGRFIIIRSGNIIGSTGSVMEIWRRQIEENNEITVTNPDMMRFYTSIDGVIKLLIAVLERGENGRIYFTPRSEAVVLKDMVHEAIKRYGNSQTRIKIIGPRPGERMAEKMHTNEEKHIVAGFEENIEAKV